MRSLTNQSPKKKRPILKIFFLTFVFLILTIGIFKLLHLNKIFVQAPQSVVQLITDTGLKSDNNRVNALVLGIGGPGHDGPYLTDTMILASIDKEGKDVAVISIPRDLWAENLTAKINSAYAYGEEKDQAKELAQETVGKVLGVPIHYVFRIDFSGFEKAIDLVSGIDIDVENSFTDPKYPLPDKAEDNCGLTVENKQENGLEKVYVKDATGSAILITEKNDPFTCRYETITFKKGLVQMDGTTALKFVRSRHGTNDEGSDFARSARQQKVILAFRQKVLSLETLTKPKTIIDLVKTFGASIDTNITGDDVPYFVKLFNKVRPEVVRRIVLDSGREESVLTVGDPQNYKSQFVLIPKSGNWDDLSKYIQNEIFKTLQEKSQNLTTTNQEKSTVAN